MRTTLAALSDTIMRSMLQQLRSSEGTLRSTGTLSAHLVGPCFALPFLGVSVGQQNEPWGKRVRRRPAVQCLSSGPSTTDSPPPIRNYFLNPQLLRVGNEKISHLAEEALENASSEDKFLPVWRGKVLITDSKAEERKVQAVMWEKEKASEWISKFRNQFQKGPIVASLATDSTRRYYALDVSCEDAPSVPNGEMYINLRKVLSAFETEEDATLAAHAQVLLQWHSDNVYCGRCGSLTLNAKGGRARVCSSCNRSNMYPRVEPSVLVLVLRNNATECLLGRHARWPAKRYSVIAGFSEIFESLEDTVVREVFEETGVIVDPSTIKYKSSQPWPAPRSSLMSAFVAHTSNGGAIQVDGVELEDAKWCGREWLRRELGKPSTEALISIPGRTSLSHRLIMDWINQDTSHRKDAPRGC